MFPSISKVLFGILYISSSSSTTVKSTTKVSIMTTSGVLRTEEFEDVLSSSIFDALPKGQNRNSRGVLIEKKIDFLESLSGKVSNRRSRRWLNDRLLIELVPRLDVEEIRGLFAPPPWGDSVPLSPFCMTNVGEWDSFRTVDMDKQACMIEALKVPSKTINLVSTEKMVALNAWHRVDCRTREALRRSFLVELIEGYEDCLRKFIKETGEGGVLVLHVQDPFHRLLLHGVCEFYDLVSVTDTRSNNGKLSKTTKIKKKKSGSAEVPNIYLYQFLKMLKDGLW